MRLSVVVVSYNVREFVKQCLDSLFSAGFSGDLEIVLVDNNSHDGTVGMVKRRFPQVRIIANDHNRGFAPALNQGLRVAAGDYILSLNPDTIVEESTLQVLADYLEADPEVGLVGPKILNSDGTFQSAAKRSFPTPWVALTRFLGLAYLFPRSRWFGRYALAYLSPDETHEVDAVSGSCMCFPARLLNDVGYMDEDFRLGGDDLDYCYRVHLAGYKVHYLHATQIIHYKGMSRVLAPFQNWRLHFEAMARFARKYPSLTGGLFSLAMIRVAIQLLALITYLRNYLATFSSLIIDAFVIGLSFVLMITARFLPDPQFAMKGVLLTYAPVVAVYIILWLMIGGLFQIYGRYVLSYSRALVASLVGFLVIATLTYLVREVAYSRLVLVSSSALVAVLLTGWRLLIHLRQATYKVGDSYRRMRPSIFSRRAVILGMGSEGQRIGNLLLKRPDMGLDLIGFIDIAAPEERPSGLLLPFIGTTDELRALVALHRLQEVIVAAEQFSNEDIMDILEATRDLHLLFRIVPHEDEFMLGRTDVENIGDLPMMEMEVSLYHRFHRMTKRMFDIILSLTVVLPLLPFWPVLILLFGLQKEVIWNIDGSTSRIWLHRRGPKFIRRLPLMWVILRGRVSFVGAEVVSANETDPQLLFKPGLTGLNQLRRYSGRSEAARSYQRYYLQHQSLTFDVEVLLKSIFGI
ncbi:MAG: glycosyltransferase [Candidatus Marinimicrobia bacterium]|nr:glycosyltransferase [Candidatus Neomarinimicrobiota bacterium]